MDEPRGASEEELGAIAERFADAAAACVRDSLARSVEGFVGDHPGEIARLDDETLHAFRSTLDAAIDASADRIAERLRELDLWTSPRVRLRKDAELEPTSFIGWLLDEVGFRRRPPADEPEERLDDPNNRVWIALLNAADPLDPVFIEFGFAARARTPDPGGGHFGLQPRMRAGLDPHGRLTPIWREYLRAFTDRRRRAGRTSDDGTASRRVTTLARWRRTR